MATGWAHAQGNVRITGRTVDQAGKPVPELEVVLTPVDAAGVPRTDLSVARVKTNKKGRFTFGFAKPGDYLLSIDSTTTTPQTASVKMRGADRRPVQGPDGRIEDREDAVDPAHPVIGIGIPRDVFTVEVALTMGAPPVAASGPTSASIAEEIVSQGLGAQVQRILSLLDARQWDGALGDIESLFPDRADVAALHYLKGFALVKQGRTSDAEAALREALRLDATIAGASGLLGQVLAEQGRFDEAVPPLASELERVAEPAQRVPLLLALGQARLELGKPEQAVPPLREAHDLAPQDTRVRVQLADAYTQVGDQAAAETLISGDLEPREGAILHYNLAAEMLKKKEWEGAIGHLNSALEFDPTLAEAHKYLAQAHLALGHREQAVSAYRTYVAAAPDAADAEQARQIIEALQRTLGDGS